MGDYGHELAFGTFITPLNQRPEDVVALSLASEGAGLDLVTFQDHPYQPAFLDTWTLLSWVAAKTETITLAGNVLNLPLRPPAVLARSAASLDLLSDGRFELGIGAGGFWDAIEAMGGPRRSPGEAVAALSEAIDVMRAVWDPSEAGGVRIDGTQYRVWGARRGPRPAHDISIWIGGAKPRMLRLVGEKGDGWLPSLAYFTVEQLERGNEIVDEAAARAGRDPRAIRRLLNVSGAFTTSSAGFLQGPPRQWVEELLPFVVERGFSTLILAADDRRAIDLWGNEVAPALREAAARERTSTGVSPEEAVRGPRPVVLRRNRIAYDAVPRALRAKTIEPGDRAYEEVRSTYVRTGSPGLVIQPESKEDVAAALSFARGQDVPLAIRSGGHGISGRSTNDDGIVIDLARMNEVTLLDSGGTRVRLGPGARWGDVARTLGPHGLAISSGDFGDVGVGGLATAGGIGFLARSYGLTIDHVVAVEMVLADGTFVRADEESHPGLFWAARGAGANFGIATAFEVDAARASRMVSSEMIFDGRDLAPLLKRWGEVVEEAPRQLTSFLYVFTGLERPLVRVHNVFAQDDPDAAVGALNPLLGAGPILDQQASVMPYAAILPPAGGVHRGSRGRPLFSNGLAVHLTDELSARIADGVRTGVVAMLGIRSVGGAVNDVAPDATAYPHRHQNFNVSSVGVPGREDAFDRHWDELRPHLDGLYLSFETDPRRERLHDAFPGETLATLRGLKAQYDPEDVFDQNFPIAPVRGAVGAARGR